ncbi:hypothetical protein E3N88_10705 [Mikania micrantha]|uniref:Uncharacterized protein n=1 Tax=Mikania micrantha TaxID=192012 RepID=A0A5N6PDD7_9ASTR|nr:hypothetical protein E3N88_10705 [Mikania micrantha]
MPPSQITIFAKNTHTNYQDVVDADDYASEEDNTYFTIIARPAKQDRFPVNFSRTFGLDVGFHTFISQLLVLSYEEDNKASSGAGDITLRFFLHLVGLGSIFFFYTSVTDGAPSSARLLSQITRPPVLVTRSIASTPVATATAEQAAGKPVGIWVQV